VNIKHTDGFSINARYLDPGTVEDPTGRCEYRDS
jgi:hypothetical protein